MKSDGIQAIFILLSAFDHYNSLPVSGLDGEWQRQKAKP